MYKVVWSPVIEEILHSEVEDGNQGEKYAVGVMINDQIVEHVSRISRVS